MAPDLSTVIVDRRRVLKMASSALGGLVLVGTLDQDVTATVLSQLEKADIPAYVSGKIAKISGPAYAQILDSSGRVTDVALAEEALLWRHIDNGASLSDFALGEEVLALGSRSESTIVASYFSTLFHTIVGRVISIDGIQIETTGGTVQLQDETVPWRTPLEPSKELSEIERDDEVHAIVWRNGNDDKWLAAYVGAMDTLR